MKLPDFLEELNQGAEKAFGDNAQHMIDSLLYAKLPPKPKRSVNIQIIKRDIRRNRYLFRKRART